MVLLVGLDEALVGVWQQRRAYVHRELVLVHAVDHLVLLDEAVRVLRVVVPGPLAQKRLGDPALQSVLGGGVDASSSGGRQARHLIPVCGGHVTRSKSCFYTTVVDNDHLVTVYVRSSRRGCPKWVCVCYNSQSLSAFCCVSSE